MIDVMIIGCGAIAPAHVEGYKEFPDQVRITVLADQNTERAEALIKQYGLVSAHVAADYREELSKVDAVSICTPPGVHRDVAVQALNAGCHVLLEKPMAPSLEECDDILEAAKKNGKLVSVIVQSRFVSNVRNVIDLVKSGEYGKNFYTRVNSCWYRGQSYYDLNWRGRWEVEGGGCTQNHSIHHIDLLLWTKGMPKSLRASVFNLNHQNSEEEDFSSSVLKYEDGSIAEITSSLISHGEPQILHFQMEQAGVEIPFKAYASKVRENGFPIPDQEMEAKVTEDFAMRPKLAHENHAGQIENFLNAIEGRGKLIATGSDGRNCIEVITGIYKSSFTEREISFPIERDDIYYGNEWRKTAPHFHEKGKDVSGFSDMTITDFKDKYK